MPSITTSPTLPATLRLPFRLLPSSLYGRLFCESLNYLLKQEIKGDELDFLDQRVVLIRVLDAGLDFHFTLRNGKISPCLPGVNTDLVMQGTLYDFLLMISRKEDPDTLFFNRRLKLSGDTELGLYVKNFLDGLEMTEQWKYIHLLSDRARRIAERLG